jgi:hypothetical protein
MVVYRGWQGEIQYDGTAIAEVQNWSVEVDNSGESHFFVGSRTAVDITVGPKRVTGNFSKMFYNDDYADYAVNPTADNDGKPASWTFRGACLGGQISVVGNNCFFTRWRASGEAEGPSVEDLDFICKNLDT